MARVQDRTSDSVAAAQSGNLCNLCCHFYHSSATLLALGVKGRTGCRSLTGLLTPPAGRAVLPPTAGTEFWIRGCISREVSSREQEKPTGRRKGEKG